MKRIVLSFVIIFLLSGLVATAQDKENDQSLLWRISGNGLAKPSYLFGTIHLICPEDYVWTEKMKQSLAGSDKVCFEMDLDDPDVLKAATGGFMEPTEKRLKDYYTAAQYQALKKFVK